MATAGDFFDEDRSETFATELFVDAEEVDFATGDFRGLGWWRGGFAGWADEEGYGDTGDESNKFPGLSCADANVPLFSPSW